MAELIRLQTTIFSLIFCGFFFRRKGIISKEGQKNITDLVIYLILPCNIVTSFLGDYGGEAFSMCVQIFLISVGLQVFVLFYGKILARGMEPDRAVNIRYATITSNAGFLGNPIAEGMYGASGLMLASVFLIPQRTMMWSAGVALYAGMQDGRNVVKKVLTHPCVVSCILGILLLITGWTIPPIILTPVQTLGRCNTALSMMVIGMILADVDLSMLYDRDVLVFSAHRLIILPAILWVVLRFLPIDPLVMKTSVLLTAMPAAAMTSMMAAKYNRDPGFSTSLVIASTLLSIPTIFLWGLLLK